MSKKTTKTVAENDGPVYEKVYINRGQAYVCYSHPTNRNEKGHVKQVTRSIKNLKQGNEYDEEELAILCKALDDLLVNFKEHTKDMVSIEECKQKFSGTKAYDWIIGEELQNNPEKFANLIIEKYIPISEYTPIVYLNATDNHFLKDDIAKCLYKNDCQHLFVNDKTSTEFSASVEFKGFKDLEIDIIKKLVYVIDNYFTNKTELVAKDLFSLFINIELNEKMVEKFIKSVEEIQKAYLKENKIKASDFHVCVQFNNFLCKRLQKENIELVTLVYELILQNINSNFIDCEDISYEIEENSTYKILYLNSKGDKKAFFETLDKILSYKFTKGVRIKGNLFKDCIEDDCVINQPTIDTGNILDYINSGNIKICLDGVLNKDYELFNLLEKIIVWGLALKCDFYFENIPNNDFIFIRDNIVEGFEKTILANHLKYIYATNFILMKCQKEDFTNSPYTEHNLNEDLIFNTFYVSLCLSDCIKHINPDDPIITNVYDVFEYFGAISYNTNIAFKTKIENFFNNNIFEYIDSNIIVKTVKYSLIESFVYALYNHLFAPDKLLRYDYYTQNFFVHDYNKFIMKNMNKISDKIDSIVTFETKKIINYFKNINDYEVYKKCLSNAITADIEIPYNLIKEICDSIESQIIRGG